MIILVASSLESFLQLIGVLLIFLFVLLITYLTTRWLSGVQKNKLQNKSLKIIETLPVGNGKYVEIIQAGDKYLVISVGKDAVSLLTELSDYKPTEQQIHALGTELDSFQNVLDKVKNRISKK